MSASEICGPLRIEKPVYGGDGLARTVTGEVVLLPFALPGELVARPQPSAPASDVHVLEPSADRVEPRCVHFGACGGCQYQMAGYQAQLAIKAAILNDVFHRAGLRDLPPSKVWSSPQPWGYRNRVRMRVRRHDAALRLGYSIRGTSDFLPITMCPISAPLLVRAALSLVELASIHREAELWLSAAAEVEFFCDASETRLQVNLLCAGQVSNSKASFERFATALQQRCPELTGAGAARYDPRSGLARESLAAWGAAGLPYPVLDETYWITRGGFFQVNRFLLPQMVELVCTGRSGDLAWDLFAGVGLFSRVLARHFAAVTAVETNPTAATDLKRALAKLGPQHKALESTTLDFLRRAALERDRPDLIVLDPPRAGAGQEACALLTRLVPREIVYVSCDPTTLARDLAVLSTSGYSVNAMHLIDLFPQTYHLETVISLHR